MAGPLYEAPTEASITETFPHKTQFQIGRQPDQGGADRDEVGVLKLMGNHLGPMLGLVENYGEADITLQCEQSSDNEAGASADTYADLPIRVDGSAVANGEVTVVPGGRAHFIVESFSGIEQFLAFKVSPSDERFGVLTLWFWSGHVVKLTRTGQANWSAEPA